MCACVSANVSQTTATCRGEGLTFGGPIVEERRPGLDPGDRIVARREGLNVLPLPEEDDVYMLCVFLSRVIVSPRDRGDLGAINEPLDAPRIESALRGCIAS